MHFLRMAGFAGVFLALLYCTSCGDTYRPVAQPIVQPGGDPQKAAFVYSMYHNPNGNGILAKIDVSGDTNMSNLTLGRSPAAVSYMGSNTGAVLAADSAEGNVILQSPSVFQFPVTLNLPAGAVPVFITSRQTDAAYVVNQSGPTGICSAGSVTTVSISTSLTTTCVGNDPVFAVQIPNGGKVYVLNRADGTLSVIDPNLRVTIGTITVGSQPVWADTNTDGSLLFVVNQGSGTVSVIDTVADAVISPDITVGTNPGFAIYDNNRNRLYVTNTGSNSVSVIEAGQATPTHPPTLLTTIGTSTASTNGQGPTSAAPLPDGTRIYVANSGSTDVSVIDATTLTLITQNAGYCTKPSGTGAVSCPNSYPTIPLLWDLTQWSATVAPTPLALSGLDPAANPGPIPPIRIGTEATSTKIYVTTPYIVPQPGQDPVQPGLTVIKTLNNSIVWNIMGPQEDPNCQKASNGGVPCPVQVPLQLLGVPH